jgi:hypothetical protein
MQQLIKQYYTLLFFCFLISPTETLILLFFRVYIHYAGKSDRVPDFVFLAHVVDILSSMHAAFGFRSVCSKPWTTHFILIPLLPVAFAFMVIQWCLSKTYTVSFYYLRGRFHQTWVVPRYGFHVSIQFYIILPTIKYLSLFISHI